jgi:methylated-DNA-[protein]-cysteine S-methyltransferase
MENNNEAFYCSFPSMAGSIGAGFNASAIICLHIGKSPIKHVKQTLLQLGYKLSNGSCDLRDSIVGEMNQYFDGARKKFSFEPVFHGTEFQVEVWKRLCEVPYGEVVSYGELAAMAGRPRAARAVGMIMGQNRVPIVAPCHRVITSDGKLGGFGCGIEVKKRLLALEGVVV